MSSNRRLDRMIRDAENKLRAVRGRETWALPASEQARLVALGGAVIAKSASGRDDSRTARSMDRIWQGAESRLAAEVAAARQAQATETAQAAADKTAKRSRGWF